MRNVSMYHANVTLTSEDAAYVILSNLTCMASMAGCVVTAGLYLWYPDIRTTARKLLVCLAVANFVQCISGLLQTGTYYKTLHFPNERSFMCESSAFLTVVGHVSSALWTCAVTTYLFLTVSLRAIAIANNLVWLYYVFCFGMPMVLGIAAGASDVYGYDVTDILYFEHPTVCWISDRVSNLQQWYFITIEGWVIAAYFLCLLFFLIINCTIVCRRPPLARLSKTSSTDDVIEEMAMETASGQLRWVPLLYCFLRVWGTAHFLFTQYPHKRHLRAFDWLLIIRAVGDNSQGLANCALFCLTSRRIKRMMGRRARQWCGWCQRQKHRLEEERWMPGPIVRVSRKLGKMGRANSRRSVDGSDLDISGISLELPSSRMGEGPEEERYGAEDEVLFQR